VPLDAQQKIAASIAVAKATDFFISFPHLIVDIDLLSNALFPDEFDLR
jgi:hypothetical protein